MDAPIRNLPTGPRICPFRTSGRSENGNSASMTGPSPRRMDAITSRLDRNEFTVPAVSEKPEVKNQEVAAVPAGDPVEQFKMPKPALGSSVLFYKYARKDQPIDPEVVFVQKI